MSRRIAKTAAFVALSIAIAMCLSACHQGQTKIAGVWVDKEEVDKYDFGINSMIADRNGDTYCKKCDKFIEGSVRICPYCGQYID